MSAVLDAIGDVFEAVGDAVGAVAEGIGDAVEWVVEKVVEPVVKAVDNTIQAALDDPLGTIVKVGTAVFAPALLPAVNFGLAVANGAPIEKALLNTAVNYVGGQVGNAVGTAATKAFDLGCFASDVVTAGAKGAISSGLKGDNILEGAVNSSLNNVINTGARNLVSGKDIFGNSSSNVSSANQYDDGASLLASSLPNGCQGSIFKTGLGGVPSSSADLGTINISAPRIFCTDVTCFSSPSSRGSVGSSAAPAAGGLPDLGTINVNAQRPRCTDVTCTFDPSSSSECKGTMLVTAERPKPSCTDVTCLGTVEVTADRPTEELGLCCKFTGFKPPELKLPQLNLQKPRIAQASTLDTLGCDAIPWLDTRSTMLNNQIVFDRDERKGEGGLDAVQSMYPNMTPDMEREMQDRFGGVPQINLRPFDDQGGGLPGVKQFSNGGANYSGVAYCYNNDAKYMPKFINCGPDFLTNSGASRRQPFKHKELQHLQPRISNMGNMGGMASGGLPKVYKDNMPKGHNPEFVTGMTGYYACGGGTGQSDDIPAMLHDGDYVMDADVVAALGDGSSKAGREVLEGFRSKIRHDDAPKGNPVPAKIADGEYVFPAGFVAALGGGDNKAGAKILDGLREKLRAHKRSAPTSKIPPKAKSPLDYIKQAKG